MPPKVSLILPTHNGARYLLESIQSCLEQSFRDFELIVVNDCSTDNTLELLESIRDERLQIVNLDQNRKLPGALNAGFARARGQYHSWTSDDNRYLPGALARLVEVLDSRPEVDVVYSDTYRLLDEQRVGRWHSGPAYHLTSMQIVGACFLYRRQVWDRVGGYDDGAFLVEDYEWWVRAWKAGFRFQHLPEVWYEYRIHGQSLGETHGRDRVHQKKLEVQRRYFRRGELWLWKLGLKLRRAWLWLTDREKFRRERWIGQTQPARD